ncbi:hypothetical protein OO382_002847, partial [Listeria monocytogenes]|nr:hypothetical protein [Listeria monocytogenes]
LKISDDFFEDFSKDRIDDFAYTISSTDFEELTIALLQLTREAIIQLTMIIQIEEDKTASNRNPDEPIGELDLFEYEDDWKL